MTPNFISNPHAANALHLTDHQLAALLTAGPGSLDGEDMSAEAHLLDCPLCADELAELRESFSIFREASVGCASSVYQSQSDGKSREWIGAAQRTQLPHPAFWGAAAAMLLTAVLLPLPLHRPAAAIPAAMHSSVSSGESDEALFEAVSHDLSASVPTQMAALADPTGGEDSALLQMPDEASNPIGASPAAAPPTSAQSEN